MSRNVEFDINGKMSRPAAHYREFTPCDELREYVRAFFICTAPEESRSADRLITRDAMVSSFCPAVFADGHVSIVVSFGREYREDGFWHPGSVQPRAAVIGAMTAALPASSGPRRETVGAYLRAARASLFTHVPTDELTDRVVALEDLWRAAGSGLQEGIVEAKGDAERVGSLESALLKQLADARGSNTAVDVAGLAAYALRRRGQLKVPCLADAAGVSRQRLATVFRESVGVSPKLYCRLARFRAALTCARDGVNLAQVAVEMGYTDQSHMIAEFREFSSVTPAELASRRFLHPFLERLDRLLPSNTISECAVFRPDLRKTKPWFTSKNGERKAR
jgi:AraC-like DNA-binding protein